MNQNKKPPESANRSAIENRRPTPGRPAGTAPRRPAAVHPAGRPAPNPARRPVTGGIRKRKRSPIPLIILLIVFLVSGGFYIYEFFIPHGPSTPVAGPVDKPPVVDPPPADSETGDGTTNLPPDTDSSGNDSSQGTPDTPPTAYTVVLDPGHGFGDVGCTSEHLAGVYEYELTLDMCQKIEKLLAAAGVKVVYTHNGSSFPLTAELDRKAAALSYSLEAFARELIRNHGFDKDGNPVNENATWDRFSSFLSDAGTAANLFNVYERAYYINLLAREEAIDAMVSVHVNSVDLTNPAVNLDNFHGYTVSYSNCNDYAAMSASLQSKVSDSLSVHFPDKRVVRYSDPWHDSLVILKYSAVPSILIETGYCVQPDEAADFLSDEWRSEMALAIAEGVLSYLGVTDTP